MISHHIVIFRASITILSIIFGGSLVFAFSHDLPLGSSGLVAQLYELDHKPGDFAGKMGIGLPGASLFVGF